MLRKSLIFLTIIGLSVITVTQALASELTIPNSIVKFPCSIHNNTTLCPQAREEGQEVIKDTGRPPRD
ncbi:MAG TPA: hypothetical protein DCQ51_00495 [Planktothrix sp. UBA8407]|jgi:hypothetical protein|nr:hypothetical protein [Planktothrix sp. UBA8402]HAO09682.1 hypothetical protein [Planktothrix sp. UBA8407]HBK23616.1 hypothetical protein [Planktothrix sp. UBA10369]